MLKKIASFIPVGFSSIFIPATSQGNEKPNVVIILADDMGYGDVSFNNPYSRTRTPNIDNLANNGICFSDAHSGGAVSIPSRYGLLTGRYYFRLPKQKGYLGYFSPLIEEERETIGSVMQKAGYTTACIGKWHLGLNWSFSDSSGHMVQNIEKPGYTNIDYSKDITGGPNSLGFDYSFILPASLDMPPYIYIKNNRVVDHDIILTTDVYPRTQDKIEYVWDRKYTGEDDIYWGRGIWWRNGEMSRSFQVEKCLDVIVEEGVRFINDQVKNKPQKPFMLYLALTGPHTPWMPVDKFKGSSEMGTYGDFISNIDDVIQQITETIRSLNIYNNTILIFTSDNGAHWSENDIQAYGHMSNWNCRGQKGDIWDGGHHIPMFATWPGKVKEPYTYAHTVSLVDIIATLVEITGTKMDNQYAEDSFSFYKVFKGKYNNLIRENIIYISSSDQLAIQKNGWKYIDCLGSGGFSIPSYIKMVEGGPKGQLYNLEADPLETTNLYLKESKTVSQLSDLLSKLVNQGYSRRME